jgi:hypothetical protein
MRRRRLDERTFLLRHHEISSELCRTDLATRE